MSLAPGVDLIIISGRDRDFLESTFGFLDITIFAEHGALRRVNGKWKSLYREDLSWQQEIARLMKQVADNTPGSFIEKRKTSLVWHYRDTDRWLAEFRVPQLVNKLIEPCTSMQLHLMLGDKFAEVKPSEYTKGSAVKSFIDFGLYDFILAAGDDISDEDMFNSLPDRAVTIKVGNPSEKARFTVLNSNKLTRLLSSFLIIK